MENNKSNTFNDRRWVPIGDSLESNDRLLRVMTYNILCDSLLTVSTELTEEDLKGMPHLSWDNRRDRIINEITHYKADVLFIQEFERDEVFIQKLQELDYDVLLLILSLVRV